MSKLFETWMQMENAARQSNRLDVLLTDFTKEETEVYRKVLDELGDMSLFKGTVQEMADHYGMEPVLFSAFLDGINPSLREPLDMESLEEDTVVDWEILPEKLFYNMNAAKAPWLYNMDEWDAILPAERRREITREWRLSGQARAQERPGRNDPCPCGSGKKYKKCCMPKGGGKSVPGRVDPEPLSAPGKVLPHRVDEDGDENPEDDGEDRKEGRDPGDRRVDVAQGQKEEDESGDQEREGADDQE